MTAATKPNKKALSTVFSLNIVISAGFEKIAVIICEIYQIMDRKIMNEIELCNFLQSKLNLGGYSQMNAFILMSSYLIGQRMFQSLS
jgi:hypothetical protein